MTIQLKVKRLTHNAELPKKATDGSACFDLCADTTESGVFIKPGEAATIDTGLAFEVPPGHVMLVFSRSGHGFKQGLRLVNCVGVIDSDYRGEVKVRLHNDGKGIASFWCGDRVAQAMVLPVPDVELVDTDHLTDTARGAGGLGSTGA